MTGLRAIRQSRGLTQAELAHKLGVTQSLVAMWERNAVMPGADRLPAIADTLGCSIDALYGRKLPQAPPGAAAS